MRSQIGKMIVGFSDRAVDAESAEDAYFLIQQEYNDQRLHRDEHRTLPFTLLFESGEFTEMALRYIDWQVSFPDLQAFETELVRMSFDTGNTGGE